MSLVNVSLKFKTLISQIHCYVLLEKCENFCIVTPLGNDALNNWPLVALWLIVARVLRTIIFHKY